MTRASVLLALRPHRFALAWSALLCLAATAVAVAIAAWLSTYSAPSECLSLVIRDTPPCAGYAAAGNITYEWAAPAFEALAILPFLVGIVLGAPLVAAEIETGTAPLVWWLEPSRRAWLLERVLVFGVGLVVILVLPAIAGDMLESQLVPRYDPATTAFLNYGARGSVLVARGIAAFAIGVAAGLLTGRVLPALIIAGFVAAVLMTMLGEARWAALPAAQPITTSTDAYVLAVEGGNPTAYADATGKIHSLDDIIAAAPAPVGSPKFYAWFEAQGFTQVSYGIPGGQLWVVGAREVSGLAFGTLLLLGASTWLVGCRRPYT